MRLSSDVSLLTQIHPVPREPNCPIDTKGTARCRLMQPFPPLWCPRIMARWEAPEAFAEFVRDRHVELLRFAYALTGDRYLADDPLSL